MIHFWVIFVDRPAFACYVRLHEEMAMPTNPFARIAPRTLALSFVSAAPDTPSRLCRCGHVAPVVAKMALPDGVPLSGGQLTLSGPERWIPLLRAQCWNCAFAEALAQTVLCGDCASVIVCGAPACVGNGTPKRPDVATFVRAGVTSGDYLVCVACSGSIFDLAGTWTGSGIHSEL